MRVHWEVTLPKTTNTARHLHKKNEYMNKKKKGRSEWFQITGKG